jgi:hypothetical protein
VGENSANLVTLIENKKTDPFFSEQTMTRDEFVKKSPKM